jgi:hypothetical protein
MSVMAVVRPALVVVALASASLAVRFAVFPPPLGRLEAMSAPDAPRGSAPRVSPVSPDSLARAVAARDIFRAGRRPAAVPFNAQTDDVNAPPRQAIQLPPLRLAGLLTGSDSTALLDGIPGSDATRVVRAGDRIGEFTVRSVTADRVVIAGRDTSWTLRLRTP